MEPIITSIVVGVLAAIGRAVHVWLKAYLTPQRLDTLINLARTVVAGAEEAGNFLNLSSEDKHRYADAALRDFAKRLGVRLTDAEVTTLIQAVLYAEHEQERATQEERSLVERLLAEESEAAA